MTESDGQKSHPGRPGPRTRDRGLLAVVGVGVTMDNLPSLERFLQRLPADSGMAYVVVTEMQKDGEDRVAHLLRQYAPAPVVAAEDGMELEPDRIHLAPSGAVVTVSGGRLRIRKAEQPADERGRIDTFFVSLAVDQKEDAVGVILAGNGSDGTLGVAALKENGGLAIAAESAGGRPSWNATRRLMSSSTSTMKCCIFPGGPGDISTRRAARRASIC